VINQRGSSDTLSHPQTICRLIEGRSCLDYLHERRTCLFSQATLVLTACCESFHLSWSRHEFTDIFLSDAQVSTVSLSIASDLSSLDVSCECLASELTESFEAFSCGSTRLP